MAMSRKHYREVADLMHAVRELEFPEWVRGPETTHGFILGFIESGMSNIFTWDNHSFDSARFQEWCENGTDK